MPLHDAIPLFCAAFVGGLLNSVAGGGGFVCFPTLLFTGVHNAWDAAVYSAVSLAKSDGPPA